MGLSLWKKPKVIRRFKDPILGGGHNILDYEDMAVKVDVQTTDRSVTTEEFGDHTVQMIKVFSNDVELRPASQETGTLGDRIWFQGKWFECRSSRLSENTFLKHWTCTFAECMNQDPPPELEV